MSKGMPLPVLYADDLLAVICKPAGLMAHASPMARGEDDFLVDRLREQFHREVMLVHRLDRATSGCVLVAFDREIAAALGAQFMQHEVEKTYLAVCRGWPQEQGVIDHPLDGGPGKPLKKPAVTAYRRLAIGELDEPSAGFPTSRYALLACTPQTGRWRQIRRHLKHVFHHLIGDTSHGDGHHNRIFRARGVSRMLLHAQSLAFTHPRSGERIEITAPLDAQFMQALVWFDWRQAAIACGSAD
ncbi:MAG: pseudouridylate synthase [Proteobacteria bacterium]|nr:pseudouridylate synthase [Pseudomonadota bacterium]